jgi:hypothetical protein
MKKLVGMAIVALFVIALLAVPVGAKPGAIKVDSDSNCDDQVTENNALAAGSVYYVWLNSPPVSPEGYWYNLFGPSVPTGRTHTSFAQGYLSFTQCGAGTKLGNHYYYSGALTAPVCAAVGGCPDSLTVTVTVGPHGANVGSDSFLLVSP